MKLFMEKVSPEDFAKIKSGEKNFIVCPDTNDLQPGDMMILEEYITGKYPPFSCRYTGQKLERQVCSVVEENDLSEGYAVVLFE